MWGDCKVTQLVSGGAGMQTQVSLSPEPVPRHFSAALLDSTAWPGIAPCLVRTSPHPLMSHGCWLDPTSPSLLSICLNVLAGTSLAPVT